VTNQYAFNPAISIDTSGLYVNAVYRKQWGGIDLAPETQVAGLRGRSKKIPLGFGAFFFNDKAGVLKRTGGWGNLSYTQDLTDNVRLSVGFSGGYHSILLSGDLNVSDVSDQLVAEGLIGKQVFDLNAGIHLQLGGFYIGASAPHILEPVLAYSDADQNNQLIRHYYGMMGYKIGVSQNFSIEPMGLLKIALDQPWQIDGGVKLNFKNIWIGGSYRTDDSFSGLAGFRFSRFNISYAYDYTTSNLKNYSSGSHEISVGFRLGSIGKDSDEDGIPDTLDECPFEKGKKADNGCPEREEIAEEDLEDKDNDGIPDIKDKCPTVAGLQENRGCPIVDSDNDGVPDDKDNCPNVMGKITNGGCPLVDSDNDGILDEQDKCPGVPGTIKGMGCPEEDSDQDGVVDAIDKCPNTPGSIERDGCPTVADNALKAIGLAGRNLYFANNEAKIWREGYPYLDNLAEILILEPNWKIKIIGHADKIGSSYYNIQLSKRRAEAVMNYLLNRGVNESQMIVEYYGDKKPFSSNYTREGRQLNRRVELEFYFN
jgi:type IX secretion system PorP/SprF family membrane protein